MSREEIISLLARIQAEAYLDSDPDLPAAKAKLDRIYTMAGDGAARLAHPLPH